MQTPASVLGDPNAYRAIFFEETHEHLANTEAILLRLQPGVPCVDELNAIFRAVHSIKGSAAMLGCGDMAALAHLQESLLDVLRKDERVLERGDVEAMLKAGDIVQAQARRHRGVIDQAPDSAPAEALLREQLARPRAGAKGGVLGPLRRHFSVRLAPLAEPIAQAELEMMLGGLAEMGSVTQGEVNNIAGGTVSFQVELEGTATDLKNVLSLLVAPELIAIENAAAPPVLPLTGGTLADNGDEFFVDPEEFRQRRDALLLSAPAAARTESASATDTAVEPTSLPVHGKGMIRVATEKIDLLVNLVGELLITEAMLARSLRPNDAAVADRFTDKGLTDLSRHTRNLQEAVMAIRMLPISNVFSRFARVVHELSARLGKRVELRFDGEATELDRGLIEKISDPLTHLVRNAIDHGLETPQERQAAGKPAVGTLRLRASQRGGSVVVEVGDDGRGLDRQRILAQAARRGMHVAPDASDSQVWHLVFEAGFSTADKVTDLSGRGVGMDVVRRNIQALGGTTDIFSVPGAGTTVTVSVPLTLAIVEAMMVDVGGETYVVPLSAVVESVSVEPGDFHALPGQQETLRVRGEYLPVLHLDRIFPSGRNRAKAGGIAVIVEADDTYAALIVDALVGQQQVVVKSLEANFRKVPGLSAATVMSDGSVALILDVVHIVRLCGRREAMLL